MYLNNVTLTGFIGGDAETRTTKSNTAFAVFSLATKNSWKDRESGGWTSRTEPRAVGREHLPSTVIRLSSTLPARKTGGQHSKMGAYLRTCAEFGLMIQL